MKDKIKAYISEKLSNTPVGRINDQDDLLGSGIIDSIGMMKLVVFIEKELNISVPDEDLTVEHFMTLQKIMEYLSKRKDVELTGE